MEDKKKRGRPKKKITRGKQELDARKLPKSYELEGMSQSDKILHIKLDSPHITNVQIAKIVGCHESTVRYYLKGEYAQKVEEAIKDFHSEKILTLQGKAFKRLEEMLDDPKTPPAVIATICKFLLEKFITIDQIQNNESIEFETIISETGSVQQIRRKITEKKNIIDIEKG